MHKTVDYSANGSFIGPSFVIRYILIGVVVGTKNPIWCSFSGIGTSSCLSVKSFFPVVQLGLQNLGRRSQISAAHHMLL